MGVFLAQSHRKNTTHAVILRPLLIYLPLIYLESHLIKHLLLREPVLPFLPGILSLLLLWLIGLGDAAWTRLTLHFLKQPAAPS